MKLNIYKKLIFVFLLFVNFYTKGQELTYINSNSYKVTQISFNSVLSVSAQETVPEGIAFNNDGSKMYIVGRSGDDVNEYDLSTNFDISTATFNQNFSVSAQDRNPTGIAFNNDGSKMYISGNQGDDINEYDLSTNFDISTASFNQNFSVSAQDTSPQGVRFNDDGSQMYVVGTSSDNVYRYALSTNFDISTASFTDSFSVSAQDTSPLDIEFNNDGTKMFIVGNQGNDINEYDLSTPYNTSTASFVTNSSVASEDATPSGIAFNTNGTKMFITGNTGDEVNEYDIPEGSYPEDASTNNGAIDNTNPLVIYLTGDTFQDTDADNILDVGSEVTVGNVPGGLTPVITLSGGDTVATLTFTGTATNNQDDDDVSNLTFTFDNTAFTSSTAASVTNAVSYDSNVGIDFLENIQQLDYFGPNSFNISIASFSQSLSVTTEETAPKGLTFNNDGSKMYIIGSSGDEINEYDLSTSFDISTVSINQTFSISAQETNASGIAFNNTGTKMYVVGTQGDDVNEYDLSVAFDVSTASFDSNFSLAAQETTPEDIIFNNDGTKMYIAGNQGNDINEYSLSVAYDVSTSTFTDSFSVSGQEGNPRGIAFNYNGTKLFVIGSSGDDILEYDLTVAYDVSTGVYRRNFVVSSQDTNPHSVAFNTEGTKVFIVGDTNNSVYEYDIDPGNYSEDLATNNGAIDNGAPLIIRLQGDTFQDTDADNLLDVGSEVTIGSVPAGLTPVMTLSEGDTVVTLTFTGNATSNESANNVSDLEFTFDNTAFTSLTAASITNSTSHSSNVGIEFQDNIEELIYIGPNAYNVVSATFSTNFSVASEETSPQGITFNNDGSKMYVIGSTSDNINEYDLSTDYDISTASLNATFSVSSLDGTPTGIVFNNFGTKIFVVGRGNDNVYEFSLSTAFDISTSSLNNTFSVSGQDNTPEDITFNNDGTKMFIVGNQGNDINEYSLSIAFDISTATFTDSFSVASEEGTPQAVVFNKIGTRMYVVGDSGNDVGIYDLSTPYDVSTASFFDNLSIVTEDTSPKGIAFNSTGTKMFIAGNQGDDINEYDILEGDYLEEPVLNNGSIDNTYAIHIQLRGDTFQDTDADNLLDVDSEVTIGNVPAGLTAVVTLYNDDTSAILTLTGRSDSHLDIDDITNITFEFDNTAFTTLTAASITNATSYNSNIGIDFIDCQTDIIYNGSWSGGSGPSGAPNNGATDLTKGVNVQSDVTITADTNCNCLKVDTGQTLTVADGIKLEVANLLQINGDIRLLGDAQLLQTHSGTKNISGSGDLIVDQTGTLTNIYQSGYWSSPVTNDGSTFTIGGVLKDGTTSTPQDINFTATNVFDGDGSTTPITVSGRWLAKLINDLSFTAFLSPTTETFNPGEGWSMKSTGGIDGSSTQNYTFVGSPNGGDYTSTIGDVKLSLIGNPYPSALDANQFISDNTDAIGGTLYFYEAGPETSHTLASYTGGYATYNGTTGVPFGAGKTPGRYIPIGQAFFVFRDVDNSGGTGTMGSSADITFSNTQREFVTEGATSVFFSRNNNQATNPILRIGFQFIVDDSRTFRRQLAVGFTGLTTAFENGFDSGMFDRQPSDMSLKVDGSNTPFVITAIESFNIDIEIPLQVYLDQNREVTFSIDAIENINASKVYLRDAVTGDYFEIQDTPVALNLASGTYLDRFSIVFKSPNSLGDDDEKLKDFIKVYHNSNTQEIVINSTQNPIKNIEVFNLLGKKVLQKINTSNASEIQLSTSHLPSAIYIIRVQSDKGILTKKIVIN